MTQRERDLADALEHAVTSLRDLANYWPVHELHETPEVTISRAEKALDSAKAER